MKDLKSLLVEGGVDGFIMNLFHSFGTIAQEKGTEYLKSRLFGIGTNDEHLFLSACAYAVQKKMVTSAELTKICKVIDDYEPSQRNRVIGTIGKEETDVTIETPVKNDDGSPLFDKKGKIVVAKTTIKANVKGAEMLAMLAKLDEEEIKKVLDTSGASNSFIFEAKEKITSVAKVVADSQVKKDGDDFFSRETWLERRARELRTGK